LEFGPITAFHVDEIKDHVMQHDFLEKLVSLCCDIAKTTLFPPQALQNYSTAWHFLAVKKFITRDLLCFVAVDNTNNFFHLGMSFHLKSSTLKELFFQHLFVDATNGKTSVPIHDGNLFH
jgi:hypothetical protein